MRAARLFIYHPRLHNYIFGDPRTGRIPIWTAARRVFFSPIMFVGAGITYVGVLLCFGKDSADDFLRDF